MVALSVAPNGTQKKAPVPSGEGAFFVRLVWRGSCLGGALVGVADLAVVLVVLADGGELRVESGNVVHQLLRLQIGCRGGRGQRRCGCGRGRCG